MKFLLSYLPPWVRPLLAGRRNRLLAVMALSMVSTAAALASPWFTKRLIDDGLIAKQFDVLWQTALLLLGIALVSAVLGGFNRWYYLSVSSDLLLAMRQRVLRHLFMLPASFYQRFRQGDLLSRLDGDVSEVQRYLVDSLLAAFSGVLALIGSLLFMFWLDWRLTLLAFVLLPVSGVFLHWVRPKVEHSTRDVRERVAAISGFMVDQLPTVRVLQSFFAGERVLRQFDGLQRDYQGTMLHAQMVGYASSTVPGLIGTVGTALVFVVGGYFVVQGESTVGSLIAFTTYLARASGPVQTLLGLYLATQRARVSLQRLDDLMSVQPAVHAPVQPVSLPAQGGELVLEQVQFCHPGGEPLALAPASFTLPAGTRWRVTGASGAGKSSLFSLLARHADPQAGSVVLDGVDLRKISLQALRNTVVEIAQDTPLFDASVRDNLAWLTGEHNEPALREALSLACLHEWLDELPDGLETRIGPRGLAMSGGQRQRLALARAFLSQPRVLILDESTSALDVDTERQILANVAEHFAGVTVLWASHKALDSEVFDGEIAIAAGQIRLQRRGDT